MNRMCQNLRRSQHYRFNWHRNFVVAAAQRHDYTKCLERSVQRLNAHKISAPWSIKQIECVYLTTFGQNYLETSVIW